MIEWKIFDANNKPKFDTHYLVTNGTWVTNGVLAELPNVDYDWIGENGQILDVTHYAEINLPE